MNDNTIEIMLFLTKVNKLLQFNKFISIYGESGTGKTTLALYLLSNYLTAKEPYHHQAVWIQTNVLFPSRRLTQLFHSERRKLHYLRNNIFITPLKKFFVSYQEQTLYLSQIKDMVLPPELKLMVIDNISHHLRYEISKYNNISEKVSLLNHFYEIQLLPLLMFCQKSEIILILIHEVSYNPQLGITVPFFHKLYNRIESIDIFLEREVGKEYKLLHLKYLEYKKQLRYHIQNNGFQWKTTP